MSTSKIFFIIFIVVIGLLSVGLFFISADFSNKIDASKCDNMSILENNDSLKIECYEKFASEKQNIKVCDKIKEIVEQKPDDLYKNYSSSGFTYDYMSESCKVNVLALLNNTDKKQCDKISNSKFKDSCYYALTIQLSDVSLCKNYGSYCVYQIAVKQKNMDLCKNIGQYFEEVTDTEMKKFMVDNCLIYYATETNDSEICGLLDWNFKDGCYHDVAIKTNNALLCDLIITNNDNNKDECYDYMARALDDVSYCEKIYKKTTLSTDCFTNYAIRKDDKKICDLLELNILPSNLLNIPEIIKDPLIYRKNCYDAVDKANRVAS